MEALDTYWDGWLNELKEHDGYNHTVLKSGQYLQDVILPRKRTKLPPLNHFVILLRNDV